MWIVLGDSSPLAIRVAPLVRFSSSESPPDSGDPPQPATNAIETRPTIHPDAARIALSSVICAPPNAGCVPFTYIMTWSMISIDVMGRGQPVWGLDDPVWTTH